MTFVIHGATGAQGAPLFNRLCRSGKPAVAAVRNTAAVKDRPALAVDNAVVASLVAAYRDAEGVFFHLPLASEAERIQYAHNFAQTIAQAKPKRVVLSTSGYIADEPLDAMPAESDSAVVTLIREVAKTGVSFAVIAPHLYLENLLLPMVLESVKSEGILRYPLRADYPVSWSSHLDIAEAAERLLTDASVTGVIGVGALPGLTGIDLANGFSQHFGREVKFEGISPEAFGELLLPWIGADAAAGVVAGYQAKARTSGSVIHQATSGQKLLGLTPRSVQQWLADVSA
ncbi:SDR family oxidoreductase [Dickeya chrysanthemi]|uniref:SDR family oxidoreductase n=1 Tax=Dickeya chrysanthemi TaxID=556 RepID=UPI001CF223F4|nr:NmrA family NAD(P)-binding protein [Dickeya chrysanthemi]MCA7006287.1 NmrA family NAD(P)-binding protein [Dickeya chrysanthemi]